VNKAAPSGSALTASGDSHGCDIGLALQEGSSACAKDSQPEHGSGARDLAAGNFVAAYGLANPAPNPAASPALESSTLVAAIQLAPAQHVRKAIARHGAAQDPAEAPRPSSEAPAGPHDPRGPQGVGQSAGAAGGMANPLFLIVVFALIAAPSLRFVTPPFPNLRCVEGHRLERPG
jgi:hypothetical protein